MKSPVLKLRITGSLGAYKVSAQIADDVAEADFGRLPENLREQLEPLQRSILNTTQSLEDRLRRRITAGQGSGSGPANNPRGSANDIFSDAVQLALNVRSFAQNFTAGADIKNIQEIGTRLFDCLFQHDVYALYKEARETAQRTPGADLPIKLFVEPPELAYVPWETLFDKRGDFHLCCYGVTPFARTVAMQEEDLYIYDKPPIRVLGMIAAPKSFIGTPYELNADAEQAALTEALRRSNDVKLCWTSAGTYNELTRRLAQGDNGARWDVFLFVGHGLESRIILEEDGGSGCDPLDAGILKGLLSQPLGPKLVILNSCRGAASLDGDRFTSTAENLVRGGSIAAVVAMQFDISDLMGTKFSPAFFRGLTLGVPIQRAMFLTRLELQRQGFTEWISPVLYMQNRDGLVVRPSPSPAIGS